MDHGSDEYSSSPVEPTKYAFLNHSTSTLTNKLPPDVDNKPLARQKRKRTSPEDQAILEAAFSRDPKPDKEARLKLVKHIALGEKEVQIWFQNRRQTSRRKSRPLLPHEIAQFQISRYGSGALASEVLTSDELEASQQSDSAAHSSPGQDSSGPANSQEGPGRIEGPSAQAINVAEKNIEQATRQRVDMSATSLPPLSEILDKLGKPQSLNPVVNPFRSSLKKSASFVRLSMTSEGNVKVVTKDALSPSPPRPVAQGMIVPEKQTEETSSARCTASLKRSASGRSRDSRAWEFWCDKDSRNELGDVAEKDGRGSAADAIGMMRAASTRKALQPVALKQSASEFAKQQYHLSRRTKGNPGRPTLQRAHTSGGRLQGADPMQAKRKRLDKANMVDSMSVYIPGNESDKENWSPGANVARNGKSKAIEQKIPDSTPPDADPEVSAFMDAGRSGRRVPGDEEMSCVEGLLSLSQGNWAV